MITLALLLSLQEKQTSTWYHSPSYSPDFLLRTRPWQGVALDSQGRVYTVHPSWKDAGNKSVCRGRIRVFDAQGEPLATYQEDNLAAAGLAVDEKNGRLLYAADQRHVGAFELNGLKKTSLTLAAKESGRCMGVSLSRNGDLLTADMGPGKVFRFYAGGHHSSFGSGPGDGDQGFNHLRRVYESPVNGDLYVLDASGVRRYSAAGRFLKRVSTGGVLAMGPDGRHLVAEGLMDVDDTLLKRFPLGDVHDAALARDGSFVTLPRGEEFCAASYDAEGKLRWRRGADFDRLTVTRKGEAWDVAYTHGLELLAPSEARKPRKVSIFCKNGAAWERVEKPVPGRETRFTTAEEVDGPGAAATFSAR